MTRDRWWEAILLAVFVAIVCVQVFIPPVLGMADNGDNAKMIGRFGLGPWHPDPSDEYGHLIREWIFDRSYYWVSDNVSSELLPITGAVLADWSFNPRHFDIRVMGAVHALLWIGCFAALLLMLRRIDGWSRWLTAIAVLFVLTDANYVAFCNSFYTDAAAFLFLGWTVALFLLAVTRERPSLWLLLALAIAGALCAMSKPQHAPLGLPLGLLAAIAASSINGRMQRIAALALAGLIPLAGILEFASTPPNDPRMPQYAVIFRKILERSPAPSADLKELGLGPEYLGYVAKDRQPLADANAEEAWWNEFMHRANRGRLLLFHLRHPWRTASMMYWDLKVRAPDRRMGIFGKYERNSGYGRQAQARRFGWWTAFRSALLQHAPWHIPIWFAIVIAGAARVALRSEGTRARIAILTLILALMALLEFGISSLSDAGETERHLFLFHVLTDFTILCAIAYAAASLAPQLRALSYRNSAMRPSGPAAQSEPSGATLRVFSGALSNFFHVSPPSVEMSEPEGPTATQA